MSALGIVRVEVNWAHVETSQGTCNWAKPDASVAGIASEGLDVLAMIGYTPAWARSGDTDKMPPDDPADFAAFVSAFVARYPQVRYIELWNEPNHAGFWASPNGADYADLLMPAYDAIKATRPSVRVGTGGTSPGNSATRIAPAAFLADMLARIRETGYRRPAGGWGPWPFDFVCHHPYEYRRLPNGTYRDGLADHADNAFAAVTPQMHNVLHARGLGGIRIWGTEAGCPHSPDAVTGSGYPGGDADIASESEARTLLDNMWNAWTGAVPWPTGTNIPTWDYGRVMTGPLFLFEIRDREGTSGLSAGHIEAHFGLLDASGTKKGTNGGAFDAFSSWTA